MSVHINLTIDGREVQAQKGETILEVARREGMYIPTMCYLPKTTPNISCRLCVVEAEGVEGFVLGCNTRVTEGAVIHTDSEALFKERQNIMKLYNVNHPLQCGVCDKSGECDLQNKTLEFEVDSQEFASKELKRKEKKWGVLSYDPYLCIMCEKCVSVCNEVVGSEALYIRLGGYKSVIDNHMNVCIQCGECISVCPVGAMASSDFQYKSNAWEMHKVPSSCTHCSSGCYIDYEVKHESIAEYNTETVYRATNDADFNALCGAGRFAYDYDLKGAVKDKQQLETVVDAFKAADTISFNSFITNEEAFILQKLKEKYGYRLINSDAYAYQQFLTTYSAAAQTNLYSADLDSISESDFIVTLGTAISNDNPMVRFALSQAQHRHKAYIAAMHPIEEKKIKHIISQFVKYEVGSEEGVLALLATVLLGETIKAEHQNFFDELDIGNICGESSVGEEEIELLSTQLRRKEWPVLVLGADLYLHPRRTNIAKLAGLIDRYSECKVMMIPSSTNTLGVSLLCDLDASAGERSIGYNVKGSLCTLSALGEGDMAIPALNQQEGTVCNIDKRVVPMNAAVGFGGYELNDIANALGVNAEHTIVYTEQLPKEKGFAGVAFDELPNHYSLSGQEIRGYQLEIHENLGTVVELEAVEELREFNGSVIYNCNPLFMFNPFVHKSHQYEKVELHLVGSEQFAQAAKIKGGSTVTFNIGNEKYERVFVIDHKLSGTIALNPTFDTTECNKHYRYQQVKLESV